MIRSIFAVFVVLFGFSLFAQEQDDGDLTPPLLLKSVPSPSKQSLLVYPDDSSVGYAVSNRTRVEAPKLSRRYIETPEPDGILPGPLVRTAGGDIGGGGPTILAGDSLTAPRVSSDSDIGAAPEPLRQRPIADPNSHLLANADPYHPPIRTASFQGVIPGVSRLSDITETWGPPRKTTAVNGQAVHLYSIGVLNHIEVFFKSDIVSSIVVRLDEPFPEEQVREVLKAELQRGRPVMIPDESGEIIGAVFPEKGVLFLFTSSEEGGGLLVRQIGIEPVRAEPFVLRAEATLHDQPNEAKRDLHDALRINPEDAKACWLLAQIELTEGNIDAAMVYCERAIRLDEKRPAYHILLARVLTRMNRLEEAKLYLEETLGICDRVLHEKALALSMLGDLYRTSANPDYEIAISFHSDAIRLASTLIEHPNQTIRMAAKDVLFEAHLGAARDVAWGRWDGKEESIAKWIDRAKEIATDSEMLAAKRYSREYPFKIAVCVLASQVGLSEAKDIEPFIGAVLNSGEQLISSTRDPILQRKYQWEMSLSLYEAVQIYQLRKKYTPALKYGEIAADYMELGIKGRRSDTDLYLLGRLYFRLGAIHAIGNKNHRAAIEWFDRAKPIFEEFQTKINAEELGRLGETFVSMGVSYWMTEQREEAVRLTDQGRQQIERGVKAETIDETALLIPYMNLSNMYKELGQTETAQKYARLATMVK